jgi:molybdate transport repressor ModE-like protein
MRQLLAIQANGSLAKAARELGMSQPSLSSAVSRMEDELKVPLIERLPQGSLLTPIGELIAERARRVLVETDELIRDAELAAGGEAGVVRIGVGSSLRGTFLTAFILKTARERPDLRLFIEVLDRDQLLPKVAARELDVAICAVGAKVALETLIVTEIFTTEAVAVAAPAHPLAGRRSISRDQFAAYPASGVTLESLGNAEVLEVAPGRIDQYVANDYDALIPLALAGLSTLMAPWFLVRPQVEAGDLVRLDLAFHFRVSFAAIATRAGTYSPIITKLIRDAAEIGRGMET